MRHNTRSRICLRAIVAALRQARPSALPPRPPLLRGVLTKAKWVNLLSMLAPTTCASGQHAQQGGLHARQDPAHSGPSPALSTRPAARLQTCSRLTPPDECLSCSITGCRPPLDQIARTRSPEHLLTSAPMALNSSIRSEYATISVGHTNVKSRGLQEQKGSG